MARDDDRQRVAIQRAADGSRSPGKAERPRDGAVGRGFSERNRRRRGPNAALKFGSDGCEREGEPGSGSGEIFGELGGGAAQNRRRRGRIERRNVVVERSRGGKFRLERRRLRKRWGNERDFDEQTGVFAEQKRADRRRNDENVQRWNSLRNKGLRMEAPRRQ